MAHNFDYNYKVPEHTQEGLVNYFDHCYEPGSFLMSVLCNDLYGAATRADHINQQHLHGIVRWIMNNAPYGSYGSREVVDDWLARGHHQQRYEKQRLIELLSEDHV